MQEKLISHIRLSVPSDFSDQVIERYRNELFDNKLNLQIRKVPFGGPYASIEWTLPTLIVVYILKPYFEEFLKGMAKDHYQILKNWLKKVSLETRGIEVVGLNEDRSENKHDSSKFQLIVFSIQSQTIFGQQIKFLFDERFSSETWNIGINNALDLLASNFTNGKTDELTIEINNNNLEKTIFARLKNEKGEWEFLDSKKLVNEKLSTGGE